MNTYDIVIIGAGAAGLVAASVATARGKSVAVLEMGQSPARKVMVSGGGNCNITNDAVAYDRYFGENTKFVRSAISALKPTDVLDWAQKHNIKLYEKTRGRYFCTHGAKQVVDALIADAYKAKFCFNTTVTDIIKTADKFHIHTTNNKFIAHSVIIATGGISFDSLGVSDIGYKIAKKFGHKIIPVRPALCALITNAIPHDLAGISMPVQIKIGADKICDDLLFTHNGIGGPAAYRASVRNLHDGIYLDCLPNTDILNIFIQTKKTNGKKSVANVLGEHMPNKVARWFAANINKNIADTKDSELKKLAENIKNFWIPAHDIKTANMAHAEIVRGGISTDEISSKTMESKLCTKLFFAGEVFDIAGDLGGFNLHWAWASGYTAGKNA